MIDEPMLLGQRDYYASIEAELPGASAPGSTRSGSRGWSRADYGGKQGGEQATVVRLYLFWRDANSSIAGYLTTCAGIIGGAPRRRRSSALAWPS